MLFAEFSIIGKSLTKWRRHSTPATLSYIAQDWQTTGGCEELRQNVYTSLPLMMSRSKLECKYGSLGSRGTELILTIQ